MKKFKLLAITMLASTLALSSCMLLPKKKSSTDSTSTEPSGQNWSDSVLSNMKAMLDGETIPFIKGTWSWEYDEETNGVFGSSKDAKLSDAYAAFGSDWKKAEREDSYGDKYYETFKAHSTKGCVEVTIYEGQDYDEDTGDEVGDPYTALNAYFTEEYDSYSSDDTELMSEYLAEAFPRPSGKWSAVWSNGSAFYIQSIQSYNETAIKTLLTSNGYKFGDYEGEEYFQKKFASDSFTVGFLTTKADFGIGYVFFVATNQALIDDSSFELTANARNYLKGASGTLTLTVGSDVPAGDTSYTVSPASAATVTPTSTGATFIISSSLSEDTEITFTATRGEFEASCKIKAYVSEIPEESVYKLDCTVAEGTDDDPYHTYTKATEFSRDGIEWSVMANTFQTPWRFGGKGLDGVDREAYTKTAMSCTVSKVEVTIVDVFEECTFNSIKLVVSKNANFSTIVEEVNGTAKANSVCTFKATKDWTDCYFKIVLNISVSNTQKNKCVQVSAIEFFGH